jgi:hypothetical protein
VGRPRDEHRAIEEIQALSQFLNQLVELNHRLAATLMKLQHPKEAQDEDPENPRDSQSSDL